MRNLKDLIRHTKDDPRESPAFYNSCTLFESALARPGIESEEYKEALKVTARCKDLIMAELDKHNAHAVVMLYGRSKHWSPAGWPQVTVPLGYLPEYAAIVADSGTDASGQTFEVPSKPLKSHPNRSAFNLVRPQHEHTAD